MIIQFPVRVRVELTVDGDEHENDPAKPSLRAPVCKFPRSDAAVMRATRRQRVRAIATRRQRVRAIVNELFARGDLFVDQGGVVRPKPTLATAIDELCAVI